ncbi:hypothetical protein HGRIS_000450 [Hohenbuehelia grisea]|uniref:Transaldolase n=1 Tax=Hohenbuehelia grisea TaxID=104357 RepID=A0ABR3JT10_9AGAR
MTSATLLEQLRKDLTVDLDSMDPSVAARHGPQGSFRDMTSNQAIAYFEAIKLERADVVQAAIDYVKSNTPGAAGDAFLQDVVDVLTVLLGKEVYPYLSGNVHAQTSPSTAYDTEKTIAHAKRLVQLFAVHGIPKERVCVKIPATPQSLVACQRLAKESIQSLATCLFSLPQAVAAVQAGCVYVAPYFNELRVHFEPALWREYEDTGKDHPMCSVIASIVDAFGKIKAKTKVMPASIVTTNEVIALAALHPDHLTLSPAILDKLASLSPVSPDSLSRTPTRTSTRSKENTPTFPDYLEDDGKNLARAIEQDAEVARKLKDALAIFDEHEQLLKKFIASFTLPK